jgi:hypothetical protein
MSTSMNELKPYSIDTSGLHFDPDVVREKYAQEREQRLRKDGFRQYQHATGDLAGFMEDRYVEPGFEREPLSNEGETGNRDGFMNEQFCEGPTRFLELLADWRAEGTLRGLEIR